MSLRSLCHLFLRKALIGTSSRGSGSGHKLLQSGPVEGLNENGGSMLQARLSSSFRFQVFPASARFFQQNGSKPKPGVHGVVSASMLVDHGHGYVTHCHSTMNYCSKNGHLKSNLPSERISNFSLMSLSPLQSTFLTPKHSVLTTANNARNITKFSLLKGRRKTAKSVIDRLYRLDWGAWISPRPGRARHLWKKTAQKRHRFRYHLFRTASEGNLLDKMVTKYWIKKKHFVDDPYESFHTRDNFWITKGVQGITSTNLYKTRPYKVKPAPKIK